MKIVIGSTKELIEVKKVKIVLPNGEEIRISLDAEDDVVINSSNIDRKMVVLPSAGNQIILTYKG